MQIVKRAGVKECIVSDLSWHVLDPFGGKMFGHEQTDALIAEGYRHSVKFKTDGEINLGVCGAFDPEPYKGNKIFSIAALIALDKDFQGATTLVLLENHDTDNGSGFAVGIVGGNVLLDVAFMPEDVEEIYARFQELCNRVNREYVLSGDVAPVGKDIDRPFTLKELLDRKGAKKLPLKVLKSERGLVFFTIAVGIFVLIVVLNTVWSYYQRSEKEIAQRMRELQSSPDYVYGEAIKRLLAAEYPIVPNVSGEIVDSIGALPIATGGWTLSDLRCDPESCRAIWKSKGGTYEDFKNAAPPEWSNYNLGQGEKDALADLKTLTCTIPIKLALGKLPDRTKWPKDSDYSYEVGLEWQKYAKQGFSATLKNPELQGVPAGIVAGPLATMPDAVWGMPWEIRDQDWSVIKQTLKEMPANTVIQSYSLRLDMATRKVFFSATGVGYVKK